MASSYPGSLDSLANPSSSTAMDASGYEHDLQHANANDAIEAIQGELGTDPAGAQSTVKDRLAIGTSRQVSSWPSQKWLRASSGPGDTTGTGSLSADYIFYLPWLAPRSITVDTVAVETTSGVVGSARLGVYGSDASTGLPGSLVSDFGTVDTTTAAVKEIGSLSWSVAGGTLYWLAVLASAAATWRVTSSSETTWKNLPVGYLESSGGTTHSFWRGYESRSYSSGFPATAGTMEWASGGCHVWWLRRS